jgi:hypothetical protein
MIKLFFSLTCLFYFVFIFFLKIALTLSCLHRDHAHVLLGERQEGRSGWTRAANPHVQEQWKERMIEIYYQCSTNFEAGASIKHSHSQIVGLPIIPSSVFQNLANAKVYFENHQQCPFCQMITEEINDSLRYIKILLQFEIYRIVKITIEWLTNPQTLSPFFLMPPVFPIKFGFCR